MKITPFDSVKNFLSIHIIKCQHYSELRPLYFKGYHISLDYTIFPKNVNNVIKCITKAYLSPNITSAKGARKSSFCLSFNHFINTFVLFLSAILKIYAVSFINVSQALITKFGRISSETENLKNNGRREKRRKNLRFRNWFGRTSWLAPAIH
jgi:hypothetical protein